MGVENKLTLMKNKATFEKAKAARTARNAAESGDHQTAREAYNEMIKKKGEEALLERKLARDGEVATQPRGEKPGSS